MKDKFSEASFGGEEYRISHPMRQMEAIETNRKSEILNRQAYDYLNSTLKKNLPTNTLEFNPPGFSNITERAKNTLIDRANDKFQLRLKRIEKRRDSQIKRIKTADREESLGIEQKPIVRNFKRKR